ncbi:MAG: tetratricopeptide repeat protein [Cyanobacteria bacterium]|nr:tetratricopeptide repeat protein [Cyanobacteriota bacterium]
MVKISDVLAVALAEHQAGKLQQAAQKYQQILAMAPHHSDVLHLLGILSHQEGEWEKAEKCLSEAIALTPDIPEFHLSLGNLLSDRENYTAAMVAYQKAIRLAPHHEEAHMNLGVAYYQAKEYTLAIQVFEKALGLNPMAPDIYSNLGNAYKDSHQEDKAIDAYQKALQLDPSFVDAAFNLANLYRDRGDNSHQDWEKAIHTYQLALEKSPTFLPAYINLGLLFIQLERYDEALQLGNQALLYGLDQTVEIYNNLGMAHLGLSQYKEAVSYYQKALTLKPDSVEALMNLGTSYQNQNLTDLAMDCFHKILPLKPDAFMAYRSLGNCYFLKNNMEGARGFYQRSLALEPQQVEVWDMLGLSYSRMNQPQMALECYQKAYDLSHHPGYLIRKAMVMPSIYQDKIEIETWRNHFTEELTALLQDEGFLFQNPIENPITAIGGTNFNLAYHGTNNKGLQTLFAQLIQKMVVSTTPKVHYNPTQDTPKTFSSRIKIGFISRLFRSQHTIGELNQGIISHLNRNHFEVIVFSVDEAINRADPLQIEGDHQMIWISDRDDALATQAVLEQQLDVLIYTDLGMDPVTYYLAYRRLAPLQCVLWGHPDTTGIPTIDYFISWKAAESEDYQNQYTEEVALFHHPAMYFYPPESVDISRESFCRDILKVPPKTHLYLCSQSLIKIHPDYDEALGEILRRDPEGHFFALHLPNIELGEALLKRWQKKLPDVVDRIHLIPRLSDVYFMAFQKIADVLLDTFYFSAGSTVVEAFAYGTPIVTLPGDHLRGRITLGFYNYLGLTDWVAKNQEEYIEKALLLGTQPSVREKARQEILSQYPKLFENPSFVRELEDFLIQKTGSYPTPLEDLSTDESFDSSRFPTLSKNLPPHTPNQEASRV